MKHLLSQIVQLETSSFLPDIFLFYIPIVFLLFLSNLFDI
nr:MAG TPA: hypothetical protein [Caudoviricetes sp.]